MFYCVLVCTLLSGAEPGATPKNIVSDRDGRIAFLGTELKPGEEAKLPAEKQPPKTSPLMNAEKTDLH